MPCGTARNIDASEMVRSKFAEMVAMRYFFMRTLARRGASYASDKQLVVDQMNSLLLFFNGRIGYDARERRFYDVSPANDETYQPAHERYSQRMPRSVRTVYGSEYGGSAHLLRAPTYSAFSK